MDTLTFLIKILDAVVDCAKFVGLLVVVVLFAVSLKYIPTKLHKFMPRVATMFLFTIIAADCLQYFSFMAVYYSRLMAIIYSLTFGMTLFFVIAMRALYLSKIERKSETFIGNNLQLFKRRSRKNATLDSSRIPSSFFLATTPVLLA